MKALVLLRDAAQVVAPRRAAQPGEQLRDRARVKAGLEQADHRLAVVTDHERPERLAARGPVQLPVLLELPDQEPGEPGQHDHGERRERAAERGAEQLRGRAGDAAQDRRRERDHDLRRDGDDREVLDRVRRRLDEQIDVEAQHVRDDEPDRRQHALDQELDHRLPAAKPQQLVDAIHPAVDEVDELAEDLEDVADEAGQKARRELLARQDQPVDRALLDQPADPRVGHEPGDDERRGRDRPAPAPQIGERERHDHGRDRRPYEPAIEPAVDDPAHERQPPQRARHVEQDQPDQPPQRVHREPDGTPERRHVEQQEQERGAAIEGVRGRDLRLVPGDRVRHRADHVLETLDDRERAEQR